MASCSITPVILCGGLGTRLWPLSRKGYPKQFARILEDESLLQSCVRRLNTPSDGLEFAAPIVVTNADFRFMVAEQVIAAGVDPDAVLIEPEPRNTGPAVLTAALHAAKTDPNTLLLVAPSDHVIPDTEAFHTAVRKAATAARAGRLVTFGVKPTRPEAGYGYLDLGTVLDNSHDVMPLRAFIEKPDQKTAQTMLETGHFLWNTGVFIFTAKDILEAFGLHAKHLIDPVQLAYDHAKEDLGFLRLDPEHWKEADNISLDHAVMEQASNLSVVPYAHHWSDLGSWKSVKQEIDKDENDVSLSGSSMAIDCENSLIRSESDTLQVVGLGLKDTLVVAMPDAVLVADMARTQDVGQVVQVLRSEGIAQADKFSHEHRPWGYFETLALSERFQVKRIVVKPGAALSLQSHVHRSEHWIVVSGTARVTIDEDVKLVTENESVYIPLGAVHRLENLGKLPMVLIEVQTGSYLGEDDIIRYEDVYARGEGDI